MTPRISRDAYGLKLAEAAALRADCTRRQVGAVIVAPDGSIVATGYNGLASGRPGCATAGACPRGQMAYPTPPVNIGDPDPTEGPWTSSTYCGKHWPTEDQDDVWVCTVSPADHTGWHIAGDGEEVQSVLAPESVHPADTGYEATGCRAVHAEVNAIIRAGRDRCVGATIYVTDEPCFHCSVVIEGAGIPRVVWPTGEDEHHVWTVPATVPAPQAATRAPTDGLFGGGCVPGRPAPPSPDLVSAVSDTAKRHESKGGPLDPEVLSALTRAVERARRDVTSEAEGLRQVPNGGGSR